MNNATKAIIILSIACALLITALVWLIPNYRAAKNRERELVRKTTELSEQLESDMVGDGKRIEELERELESEESRLGRERSRLDEESAAIEREKRRNSRERERLDIEKEKYENLKKLYDDLKKLSEDSEKSTKRSWPGIIDYIIWGAIGVLCFLAGKGI